MNNNYIFIMLIHFNFIAHSAESEIILVTLRSLMPQGWVGAVSWVGACRNRYLLQEAAAAAEFLREGRRNRYLQPAVL